MRSASFAKDYKKVYFSNFIKNKPHFLFINCISLKDDFKYLKKNVFYFKLYNSYGTCPSDIKNERNRSEIRSGIIDSKKDYSLLFDFKLIPNEELLDWISIFQIKCQKPKLPLIKIQTSSKNNSNRGFLMIENRYIDSVNIGKSKIKFTRDVILSNKNWINNWNSAKIDFKSSRYNNSLISININGIEKSYFGPRKGKNCYFKFGLYSNRYKDKPNSFIKSELYLKDVKLKESN